MAYELEAIDSSTPQTPIQTTAHTMKEDKEVNSYISLAQSQERIAKAMAKVSGQTNTNSSAVTEEPVKTEETVALSPQMAALARKEQKFRQQEAALKAREKALEDKLAKATKLEALEAKISAKDFSGIEEQGVSYDEYQQWKLDQLQSTDPNQVALKKLESELDAVKKAQAKDLEGRFAAAVSERRNAVTQLVATSKDYPAIKKAKATEHVVQHILDTWEQDDIDLPVETAAKEVETALREQAAKWADILKDEQPTQEQPSDQKKLLPQMKPGLKTLTNQMATGELKRPARSYEGMSDEQRYQEAYRRAQEKLSKQ